MQDICPNFLVIGAMKSGTTSIYKLLGNHPEINICLIKEPRFFNLEVDGQGSWELGLDWYRNLYYPAAGLTGEVSTSYTDFPEHQGVPQRIHSINAEARIVYVLRNPVDRALSHYCHRVIMGREERLIHRAMGKGINRYITQGMYFLQLQQYMQLFPMKQICVLMAENMWKNPDATKKHLARFLEIGDFPVSSGDEMPHENGTYAKLLGRQHRNPLSMAQKQLWETAKDMPEGGDARALASGLGFGTEDVLRLARRFVEDAKRLNETFGVSTDKWFPKT